MCDSHRHLGSNEAPRIVQVPKKAAADTKKVEAPIRGAVEGVKGGIKGAIGGAGIGETRVIEADAVPVVETAHVVAAKSAEQLKEEAAVLEKTKARLEETRKFGEAKDAIRVRLASFLRDNEALIDDKEISPVLAEVVEVINTAILTEDKEILKTADIALTRAETRAAALKAAKAETAAIIANFELRIRELEKNPESNQDKIFRGAIELARSFLRHKDFGSDTTIQEVNKEIAAAEARLRTLRKGKNEAPPSEKLAIIAKERAIRSALNGAVRTAQTMGGRDFNTVVLPWRDGLTRSLAKACGLPNPDDRTLRNPGTRNALYAQLRTDIEAAIGKEEMGKLLPNFILKAS